MRIRWPAALLPAIVLSAAIVCAAGCTPVDPVAHPGTLAVVLPALEGRFQDVADELTTLGEDAGYVVEVHGTDGDIPAQVTTVAELLDRHVDALVVWPIDTGSLTPVIDGAPASTMVLSMGEMVRDTDRLDGYVGFDAYGAGASQATMLLEGVGLLEPAGAAARPTPAAHAAPFRIELVLGSPEDPRTGPSYDGAMSVLQPYLDAGTVVIESGEAALDDVSTLRGNAETASSRLTRILRESYPGTVPDAVLATSDELARGVAGALIESGAAPGQGFPVITGRGCQLRSLAALVDGRQYSSLLEDPRVLATAAFSYITAERAVSGGGTVLTRGRTIDNGAGSIPAVLVTGDAVRVDDIDAVVVASGYWSRKRIDDAIDEFGIPAP